MKPYDYKFVAWKRSGVRCEIGTPDQYRLVHKWNRWAVDPVASAMRTDFPRRPRVMVSCDVFEDFQGPLVNREGATLFRNPNADGYLWMNVPFGKHKANLADMREELFAVIDETPNLDWILVTSHPENVERMWCSHANTDGRPPSKLHRKNVWLLATIENQETADARIPELLKCRGLVNVLGVSAKPLSGPLYLSLANWIHLKQRVNGDFPFSQTTAPPGIYHAQFNQHGAAAIEATNSRMLGLKPDEFEHIAIDWVLAAGDQEPVHPDWLRELRDQCAAAATPFYFHGWGEWLPSADENWSSAMGDGIDDPTGRRAGYPAFKFEDSTSPNVLTRTPMRRVGKDAAGRLLDGVTHDAFPQPVSR